MVEQTSSATPQAYFPNFTKLPVEIQELIYRYHLSSSIFTIYHGDNSSCRFRYGTDNSMDHPPRSTFSPSKTSSTSTELIATSTDAELYARNVSSFFSRAQPDAYSDPNSSQPSWLVGPFKEKLIKFFSSLAQAIHLPQQSTNLLLTIPTFHFTSLDLFTNIIRILRQPQAPLNPNPDLTTNFDLFPNLTHLSLRMIYPRTWSWDYRSWEACLTRAHLPRLTTLTLWFPDLRHAFEAPQPFAQVVGRPRLYFLKTICNVKGLRDLNVNCEAPSTSTVAAETIGVVTGSNLDEDLWLVALGEVLRRNCCNDDDGGRSSSAAGEGDVNQHQQLRREKSHRFDESLTNIELRDRVYRAMRVWLQR